MANCDVHVSKNKTRAIKTTNRHMSYMYNCNDLITELNIPRYINHA